MPLTIYIDKHLGLLKCLRFLNVMGGTESHKHRTVQNSHSQIVGNNPKVGLRNYTVNTYSEIRTRTRIFNT